MPDEEPNPDKDKDILTDSGLIDIETVEPELVTVDESVLESEAGEHFEKTPDSDFQFHKASYHTYDKVKSDSTGTVDTIAENFNKRGIRQAIIMAEILSPPLSKRPVRINRIKNSVQC